MVTDEMRRQYARLAVRRGVNVQKGQEMYIKANARDYEFVRLCVQEAYEAGASRVSVDWRDDITDRMKYKYETKEKLCEFPQWIYDREKFRQDRTTCALSIVSDTPGLLMDVPDELLQAAAKARKEKMGHLLFWLIFSQYPYLAFSSSRRMPNVA